MSLCGIDFRILSIELSTAYDIRMNLGALVTAKEVQQNRPDRMAILLLQRYLLLAQNVTAQVVCYQH